MAEQKAITLTEREAYPFSALFSDTGGAAGLFIGLNVLGIKDTRIARFKCSMTPGG